MADGRVVIAVDADGRPIRTLNSDLDQLEGKGQKSSRGIKEIAAALGAVKIASVAFNVLKDSVDAAISRFDTMQKYPKVMKALGFSADDSKKSVKRLADGIDGLPTRLDTVVSTAQRMTAVTGNMNKSTDATIALNNAMLASGASTADAGRGMEQYIQMLSTGKVDMQSWRTLQETMPIGLQKTAEAMGFVGETAQTDLYAALKDGKVTFKEFQDHLIKLGTGTGELAKLARINSEGIGTSFENLKSSVIKGLANILQALDDVVKASTGKTIAQNIDGLKAVINAAFTTIEKVVRSTVPAFKAVAKAIGDLPTKTLELFKEIAETAFTIVASTIKVATEILKFFAATVAASVGIAIDLFRSMIETLQEVVPPVKLLGDAIGKMLDFLKSNGSILKDFVTTLTAILIIQKVAIALTKTEAAIKLYLVGTKAAEIATAAFGVAQSVLAGTTSLATVATTAFNVAIKALLGPIGWVTAAITVLVAAGVALWKHFNKEPEAAKKTREEFEKLTEETKTLAEETEKHIADRKDEMSALEGSSKSTQTLISEIARLSEQENKSTKDKNAMEKAVEELNNSMEGLNLAYDKQNDSLSKTPDQIKEQVSALNDLKQAQTAQEQINEIVKERNEIEGKLSEIKDKREALNKTMADSPAGYKKVAEAGKELDEQEASLVQQQKNLQGELTNTTQIYEESMGSVTEAVKNGVFEQKISFESLSPVQKEVMESMRAEFQSLEEKAGNAFDQIQQKSAISVDQMIENMQKNQEAIASWGKNISELAEKHVDQGLLEQLRKMGPEGAAQAAELNTRSAEELQALNETYRNSSQTAMNAMKEGYELGKNGVNEEVASIMPTAKNTLTQSMKDANFGEAGSNMTSDIAAEASRTDGKVKDALSGVVDNATKAGKEKAKKGGKEIGENIPKGAVEGIKAGKSDAEKASSDLASGISEKAKDKLGVHSPSRVFHEIGENVTKGLDNGIQNGKDQPKQSISSVVDQMIEATNRIADSMENSGRNAMIGLANGINANANSALNAARNVANQITETIQNALDIHSPSRVMRDQVGRFIPQGIAVGIDKDASEVVRSMRALSEKTFGVITPELALGGGQSIGKTGIGRQIINNQSASRTENYSPTFNFTIEHADLSNDQSIEETGEKLAQSAERKSRRRF
ncbi:hypothetical protein IGI39_003990 [Enterococcus sp. AZ135]|uniref:tape measure protein n=1 Tax=unclassified Enterococcus TaxID=2608891 RepID=UPI003F22B028